MILKKLVRLKMEICNPDPVDREQISVDKNWRKSRVFHITYSTHYPKKERKLAIQYINDLLAGQVPYEQWKRENGDLQS